jgi:hypothetical protein
MPKARVKFPLDRINGTIWGQDRTIGREPGLESACRANTTPSAADKTSGYNTKLVTKKAPTRGGSPARHTRAQVYCDCDHNYQLLGSNKMRILNPWWKISSGDANSNMSPHSIWMKCCLKYMPECAAFRSFCWYQRYQIRNDTNYAFENTLIILEDIPHYQVDGQDVEVYSVLGQTTKKGRITYDRGMIDTRLAHEVTVPGEASIHITALQPGASLLIDVYSYTVY